MSRRIADHIRSNVVGYVAVFLALTGVSYAASLPANSVKSKTIKNGQVKSKDIAGRRGHLLGSGGRIRRYGARCRTTR